MPHATPPPHVCFCLLLPDPPLSPHPLPLLSTNVLFERPHAQNHAYANKSRRSYVHNVRQLSNPAYVLIFEGHSKYKFKLLKKLLKFGKFRASNHSMQADLFIGSLKKLYGIPTIKCILNKVADFNLQLYLKFAPTSDFLNNFLEFLRKIFF